ncbi:aldo/keto reductase [Granulicella arctica]|uniref:aldo/keto reductase n=1 Tax=Granulicella arctica TaxID=940613 RepID=UPI0021E09649|nr:aldo/keto reductase [Granulicella arctica]
MRYLDRDDLPASLLGFGCGPVLGRVGRNDSLRAMGAAWDAGINLFDTARSYGYGEAEGLLGEFLAGKRERAVILTKFGIWPEQQQGWKQMVKPMVRGLLKLAPGARALVRRGAAGQMTANQFTVPVLRKSLEESLRKLRTEYVDVLFLHSAPASVMEQADLMAELERVVAEGKVRFAGISAEPEVIGVAIDLAMPVLRAMQFPANVFDLAVTEHTGRSTAGPFFVANHPFGGVMRVAESKRLIAELAGSAEISQELREKLEGGSSLLLADVVFSVILRGTGIDAVVPAMMKVENLLTNVKAISESRFTDVEVMVLRKSFLAAPGV